MAWAVAFRPHLSWYGPEQKRGDLDWKNTLYFGDNLEVLRANVPSESVDLIYLDPPFNSNANYNVLFAEKSEPDSSAFGRRSSIYCGR